MALKYPDILINNNPAYALVEDTQFRGGAIAVADISARDSVPLDKRKVGMLVSYGSGEDSATARYTGTTLEDTDWTNEDNWKELSGGGEHPTQTVSWSQLIDMNTNNQVKIWDRFIIVDREDKPLEVHQIDDMGELWYVWTNDKGTQALYKLPKNTRTIDLNNLPPLLRSRHNRLNN